MYLEKDFKELKSAFTENEFFEELHTNPWDFLIEEWSIDSNIYIILEGNFSVEKYIDLEKSRTKQIAMLWVWSIIWEQSLNNPEMTKRIGIKSISEWKVLKLDTVKDILNFNIKYPELSLKLFFEIIKATNERLNNVNEELTYVFELNNYIKTISDFGNEAIKNVIDKIWTMIHSDYAIFLKQHHVLKETYVNKYDSRTPERIPNIVIEKENWILNLFEAFKEMNIDEADELIINKVNIWRDDLGYLICARKENRYTENEKKILKSFATSIASLIKELEIREDTKNMNLLSSNIEF